MSDSNQFSFNISLSVLNHLGRNLYRNFITVLGEGISNSWDADAKNVRIYIDRDKDLLLIKDDGIGMTANDFRYKFLKVGYSKRGNDDSAMISPGGRPYIGRKGIGKLALLSCAKKVSVLSKTDSSDYMGGTIDNSALDGAISEDQPNYDLEQVDQSKFASYTKNHLRGTIILFEGIYDSINKTEDYLRKVLALYFRFSLVDPSFHIFLNDAEVTEEDLKSLAEKTEFLWNINTLDDPYITQKLVNLKNSDVFVIDEMKVNGFIASVIRPRYLKITDTEEKAGVDLFVNGRLRERDILKHMPSFSTRIVASYLYGQIHFNSLDSSNQDNFTTSRESIKEGNPEYDSLLKVLKEDILGKISSTWDLWRLKADEEGDDENPAKTVEERRAKSLYVMASRQYKRSTRNPDLDGWIKEIEPDAEFNIPAYVNCFVSENLIRKYVAHKNITLSTEATTEVAKWRGVETNNKNKGNISIGIREEDNDLEYLDMSNLANLVDKRDPNREACLARDANEYKPIRDAVAHTSLLTNVAKLKLTSVYENIKGRITTLLSTH